MLNQTAGDRQILAKQLGISNHQLSYVIHSGAGEGLLFYENFIIPFVDRFPKDTELYRSWLKNEKAELHFTITGVLMDQNGTGRKFSLVGSGKR